MVRPVSQAASLDSSSDRDSASPKSASARLPFGLTLGLFVVSGATGLVDQLCFSKYLGYVVGSTAHAVSAATIRIAAVVAKVSGSIGSNCSGCAARATASLAARS